MCAWNCIAYQIIWPKLRYRLACLFQNFCCFFAGLLLLLELHLEKHLNPRYRKRMVDSIELKGVTGKDSVEPTGVTSDEEDDSHLKPKYHKCMEDSMKPKGVAGKNQKHVLTSDEEDDYLEATRVKPKYHKRWWETKDIDSLYRAFGKDITNKKLPTTKRIATFLPTLSQPRTVAQVRTQIHNYVSGKLRKRC